MPKNETEARDIYIAMRDAWDAGRAAAPTDTNPFIAVVEAFGPVEEGTCIHCGLPTVMDAGRPTHRVGNSTYRGCRAASFDPDEGWNEKLDRKLQAKNA
jgi:hypothetical protein